MSEAEYRAPFAAWLAFLATIEGEEAAQGWPLNSTSLALESARLVKSGAGRMFGFGGYNSGAAQFVLVFDTEKLPSAGAVAVFVLPVAATSAFGVFWGDVGRFFNRGMVLCNSSTEPTLTAGAADCFFDAQYV